MRPRSDGHQLLAVVSCTCSHAVSEYSLRVDVLCRRPHGSHTHGTLQHPQRYHPRLLAGPPRNCYSVRRNIYTTSRVACIPCIALRHAGCSRPNTHPRSLQHRLVFHCQVRQLSVEPGQTSITRACRGHHWRARPSTDQYHPRRLLSELEVPRRPGTSVGHVSGANIEAAGKRYCTLFQDSLLLNDRTV